MFEAVNAGWMELGVEGTEHVAGTTSALDVFAVAQKAAAGVGPRRIRNQTETDSFRVGRIPATAHQFQTMRSASTPA